MSFQIHLGLIGASAANAKILADTVTDVTPLHVAYDKNVKLLGNPTVAISEAGQGTLANSLLCDDADWNSPHWLLRPEALVGLTETVTKAFSESTEGILFRALWISDRTDKLVDVTLPELTKAILDNRVPNKTLVVVAKRRVP